MGERQGGALFTCACMGNGVAVLLAPVPLAMLTALGRAEPAGASFLREQRADLVVPVAVLLGLTLVVTVAALAILAGRRSFQGREAALLAALHEARGRLDRALTFLAATVAFCANFNYSPFS